MKHVLLSIVILFCSTFIFAQTGVMNFGENKFVDKYSNDELTTFEVINVENVHSKAVGTTAEILYQPALKEVRLRVTYVKELYSEEDQVTCVRDILLDFIKTKDCYHYTRFRRDSVSFKKDSNGTNIAVVDVYVKIYR